MPTFVVGIAGGTGSGKTTIARHIAQSIPAEHVTLLEHDSYYRDRSDLSFEDRCQLNFDHPDALQTALLVEHVNALKQGKPIHVPSYDFATHRRRPTTRDVAPTSILIVEGILVLASEELRKLFDIRIFVDTDPDIRAFRRIRRDIEDRGRTFQSVREQYYETVRPMHLQFVEPSKRWADIIIPEGGDNRVALDLIVSKLQMIVSRDPQSP